MKREQQQKCGALALEGLMKRQARLVKQWDKAWEKRGEFMDEPESGKLLAAWDDWMISISSDIAQCDEWMQLILFGPHI